MKNSKLITLFLILISTGYNTVFSQELKILRYMPEIDKEDETMTPFELHRTSSVRFEIMR